ncbi:MAG: InlB B-repeat-containing protein [Clostridia bacterium]|nr:InlB B-repeat-containing protein [Clostridia bacterium]
MKRVVSILLTVLMLAGVIAVPGVTVVAANIRTGTLVTFGSYPQSRVTDSSLLAKLNAQSLSWIYYDYYCDGRQENYMKYADVALSGERYRAVTFTHYRPSTWDKTNDKDLTNQDENGYEPNKVYWFKFDPIIWRVLDANEGLLMTENLIDSQPFHNVCYKDYYSGYRYVDQNHTHYASNWAYSSLRSWINGDFYNTAFNSEKSYIKNTSLITPSGSSSEFDADPTNDNVYLLTRDDVLNQSYGFSSDTDYGTDTNRIAYGTDYAKCQGLGVNDTRGNYYSGASWWHLRTPSSAYSMYHVFNSGSVYNNVFPDGITSGIRPALKANLKSAISQSLIKIVDSDSPAGSISVTNNVAPSQTVTLSMSANTGVSGYYWGNSSTYTENSWNVTDAVIATKTVSTPGTYYFNVKSKNGIVSPNYTITFYKTAFDTNGGSVSPGSVLTMSGNTFTFPTPSRSGYTFDGWYTAASGGTKVASSSKISANTTVYAHWTAGITEAGADINTGTLVTFGSYPQSLVRDSDTIAALNTKSLSWKWYKYYCSGKQENYMKYADTNLSGERYRAVTFSHYRPGTLMASDNDNETYQDENGYEPDKIYWFRYEPIVWRVLDTNEGLLMTENLIDSQPFHEVFYYKDGYYYGDQNYTHHASNWAYSSLRSWMNGDFYNTAFDQEKNYIKTTSLTTPSSYSSEYDADPTNDNVFLLAHDDVLNLTYGFSSSDGSGSYTNRLAFGTDYAKCQGLEVDSSTGYYWSGMSMWLLRTPGYNPYTDAVSYVGSIGGSDGTSYTRHGIRPALKVNLKSAISQSLIKTVDFNAPTGSISSTNNVASNQTVTLSMSDNTGVAGYYWGNSPTYTENSWTATSDAKTTKTVSSPGTYYFTVKDENGNVSPNYSITFYKTTFDANGGSVSPASVLTKEGNTFTFPTPSRSGYTFDGWYTAASGGTKVSSSSTISANTTVYAHWTVVAKNTYTVRYDSNGGGGAPSSQTKTAGIALTLSTTKPSKSYTITYNANNGIISVYSKPVNCTFNNWNTNKDGSGITYNPGASYTTDADLTLYAQWKNPTAGELATPTRSGYTFDGWYSAVSGGIKVTAASTISENTTLYAHWTPVSKNTYIVNYDANGGSDVPSPQTKTEGIALTLSTTKPSKSYTITYNANSGIVSPSFKSVNCTFNNWNTKRDGSGTTYNPGASYTTDADLTLYAQWKNPTAGELATPTRSGYTFDGWYTAASGGTKVTLFSIISANTTIYAHWTKQSTPPASTSPFVWGSDNWNFINSTYYGDFASGTYRRQINSTYLNALEPNLTNTEYQAIFVGDDDEPAWLDEDWGGSCYGMSSTILLAKQGLLPYSQYTTNATKLNELDRPTANVEVSSLITYYQMLQVKDVIQQQYRTVPHRSNETNIKQIISLLDKNPTVLIGFEKEKWGGHAILAYGYEYGSFTYNGVTYQGCIRICDPNASKAYDASCNIYFNTQSYQWAIPFYSRYGITSAKGAVFNYIGANVYEINEGGYLNGTTGNKVDNYIARINAFAIGENRSVSKVQQVNGNYTKMNAGPDDIIEDYSYILGNESEGTFGYNLRDGESAYIVSQEQPDKLSLSMDYENCFLTASSAAGKSATFDNRGFVEVEGESAAFTMSMTFDDDYPTDWYTVQVSGEGADHASLEKTEEGYVVSGDVLKNVSVRVNNREQSAGASFSTSYPSALIYEINEMTVGVRVDTDGDGIYETDIGTVQADDPSGTDPSESTGVRGDADGDGEVLANDARMVLRASAKLEKLDDAAFERCDLNGDGNLLAEEARMILRYSAKLEKTI